MRKFLLAAGAALAVITTGAGAAEPRDVVRRVADQIAANYFDPAKGAQIARDLKAEASGGAFDRYKNPLDLAEALSSRLRPLDGHFQVQWSKGVGPAAAGPAPRDDPDFDREARTNYGFRKVEILPGNLGLIDLRHFAGFQTADGPARKAADAAMTLLSGTDAIIIDLRDNGGGSPAMVGYLASWFAPKGAEIYNTFKSRSPDASEAPTFDVPARRIGARLYVLTSGRTGSAAEAFAYTVQSAKLGVVVGERSGGAANPGDFRPAGDGFRVFVSSGRPVNPITRTNWEQTGVTPDVSCPADAALATAQALALRETLKTAKGAARTEAEWALAALTPVTVEPATLAGYAGVYGGRKVSVEDGRLVVRRERRPPYGLIPVGPDTFAIADNESPMQVRFERDAAGKPAALLTVDATGQTSRSARVE